MQFVTHKHKELIELYFLCQRFFLVIENIKKTNGITAVDIL